jgi:hypothetical protein
MNQMNTVWYIYLGWIVAAGLLGFATSFVFASLLHLPRRIFLVPYVLLSGLFLYSFIRWSGIPFRDLIRHNWVWGLVGAALLAVFLVRNILSQPVSQRTKGGMLAFDILWLGVIYGLTDALLLSVFPVAATWQAFTLLDWTITWPGKILAGLIAILASLLVTAAYHLGYPEYKGRGLMGPVIGNATMTLGYLLTTNPLAAMLSHIAMHIAGVFHGPASVTQLPPHYQSQ